MLRLSKLSDYGTLVMTALAAAPDTVRNAQELADDTQLSVPTVSKLLKLLTRAGLLASQRGAHGGYRLARSAATISVADVVGAIEGPLAVTECADHGGGCSMESSCSTRANWRLINAAIHTALASVTIAQMAAAPAGRPAPTRDREFPLVRA